MRELLCLCLEMSEKAYCGTSMYTISQPSGCRAVIQNLGHTIVIAFAGSECSTDWIMNAMVGGVSFHGTLVHRGFLIQYNSVRHSIMAYLGSMQPHAIVCCGHSLGGAVATLCALDLALYGHSTECVTFGSPRVGCQLFSEKFAANVYASTRASHVLDPVTYIPMCFTHVPAHHISLHTCTLCTHSLQSYHACIHGAVEPQGPMVGPRLLGAPVQVPPPLSAPAPW